jgi:hypothetical protein
VLKPGEKVITHHGEPGEITQPVYGTNRHYVLKDEDGRYRVCKDSAVILASSPEGQKAIDIVTKINLMEDEIEELYKQLEALFPQPKHRKPKEAPVAPEQS